MWLFELLVSLLPQSWHFEVRISGSVSESPLEFEITRVDYIFNIISNFRSQITYSFIKCGWSIYFFLSSANLKCRGTDISKYFRVGLRDNESLLYLMRCRNVMMRGAVWSGSTLVWSDLFVQLFTLILNTISFFFLGHRPKYGWRTENCTRIISSQWSPSSSHIRSTVVISKSKRLSEILRDKSDKQN